MRKYQTHQKWKTSYEIVGPGSIKNPYCGHEIQVKAEVVSNGWYWLTLENQLHALLSNSDIQGQGHQVGTMKLARIRIFTPQELAATTYQGSSSLSVSQFGSTPQHWNGSQLKKNKEIWRLTAKCDPGFDLGTTKDIIRTIRDIGTDQED